MFSDNAANGTKVASSELISDGTLASFAEDVLIASKSCPVVVDFWAPNCAPCAELTPTLERLVTGAKGTIKLVKINLQQNPDLATQFQIQSVPTVFIFKDGRPVDGFTGVMSESELKKLFKTLIGNTPNTQRDELIAKANSLLDDGDAQSAAEIYADILSEETENPDAIGGLIKCYIAVGELETAKKTLNVMPKALENEPAIQSAKAALELSLKSGDTGDIRDLQKILQDNPDDHQIRFDLALALNTANDRIGAINQLMGILTTNKDWNEGAAKIQLLELFDLWGPKDPSTIAGRKKLSSLLFS